MHQANDYYRWYLSKELYHGRIFVATYLDGNNQLYPIAIGVLDLENKNAWEWFMMKLHRVIGNRPELVIISDRCTSIKKAILKAFRNATHGVCFFHVKSSIKSKFRISKFAWGEFELAFYKRSKSI